MTDDQNASRVTIAKEHFERFNYDENQGLNWILTGDEMWVHHAEPKTKACLDLSVSSSSWGLGRAAVCDCGTPWTFLLTFFIQSSGNELVSQPQEV